MKNYLTKKPWYFALVVLGFILDPPLKWLVMQYVDQNAFTLFLNTSITLKTGLPILLCILILLICMVIYILQLKNKSKLKVSPDEMNTLNKILTKIVQEHEYIESVQAYQFQPQNDKNLKYIKLNYLCGAANERIEINSILQTYYYFTYSIYKKIVSVSGYYDSYVKEKDPIKKQDYYEDFRKHGHELCELLLNKLNELCLPDDIKDCHCEMYRTLAKMLPAISGEAIEWLLENREVELALIKKKKTGILGSIILNELYIFRNQNSLGKQERIYFTFPFDIDKHIILIASINGACFPSENQVSVEKYCNDVIENICLQ